jgi:hypothetical protein
VSAVVIIGVQLPDVPFLLKYNSVNDFSIFFWNDEDGTIPTDLTGAVATIEVDIPNPNTVYATGVRVASTNEMQFVITAVSSTTIPSGTTFRVVLTKSGSRFIIASGKVRVQK